MSDQIVVMRNASIAQIGTPRQLYDAPVDRFVADFIGEANIIPCEITSVIGDDAEIAINGYRYTLPSRGLSPGPASLAVRPSRIELDGDHGFEATVAKATYVGIRMEYTLEASFGAMFAVHEDVYHPLEIGQKVKVGFSGTGPVLIPGG